MVNDLDGALAAHRVAFSEAEQGRYDSAQAHATIAIAYALIALVKRLDQMTTGDWMPALRITGVKGL